MPNECRLIMHLSAPTDLEDGSPVISYPSALPPRLVKQCSATAPQRPSSSTIQIYDIILEEVLRLSYERLDLLYRGCPSPHHLGCANYVSSTSLQFWDCAWTVNCSRKSDHVHPQIYIDPAYSRDDASPPPSSRWTRRKTPIVLAKMPRATQRRIKGLCKLCH